MRISDWSSDVCSSDLYIASLGVDAIWLSPFYPSPMDDFGYDIADYCDVDPIFGSLADFDALVARAHALELKVTTDLVFAHTSDRHQWFADSRAGKHGEKADWYVWRSEEHTSALQSLMRISYAVFCLSQKKH